MTFEKKKTHAGLIYRNIMVKKIKTKIDVPKNDCTLLSFKTFFTHIKKKITKK